MTWQSALLDRVAKRGSGHTPDKQHPEYWGGEIKWISLKDTSRLDHVYISETAEQITRAGVANSSAVEHPSGTVVLSRDAGVGKSAITTTPMAVSQHFIAWQCSERLNNLFLYYWLQSKKPEFERIAMGNTIKTIGLPYFKRLEVPLPPIEEQRAIAGALSDVDELIAGLERLIAKKRDIKQATMQQLLTGQTRLPGFSGKWEPTTLGAITKIKTGSRNNEDKVQDGAYPLFVRSQTVETIDSYSYDCEAILVPGEGGIGSIFHYVNGKFDCHQRVYKISDFGPNTCGKFVFYLMKHFFHKQATRNSVKATVDSLRLPTFTDFEMTMPSLQEQERIVSVLDDCDAELTALEAQRDKTRLLKQGMMQELLTGKTRLV